MSVGIQQTAGSGAPDRQLYMNRNWRRHAQRHQQRLLEEIADAGPTRAGRKLIKRYLNSRYIQSLAMFDVFNAGQDRDGAQEWAAECLPSLFERVTRLDPGRPSTEPIAVSFKFKPNGGGRVTNSYGPVMRARQRMVRQVLQPLWRHQFLYQRQYRGGMRSLFADIRTELKTGLYQACAIVDVANCFDSVSHAFMHNHLPLPKEVIDHTVIAEGESKDYRIVTTRAENRRYPNQPNGGDNIYDIYEHMHYVGQGWRGLPQGSACSPIIAYWCLEGALQQAGIRGPCFVWGDDILLLAQTLDELHAQMIALRTALECHPAGPFLLGREQIHELPSTFQFLKLDVVVRSKDDVAILVSRLAYERALMRANELANLDIEQNAADIYQATDYLEAWAAVSAADDANRRLVDLFRDVCYWHELEY